MENKAILIREINDLLTEMATSYPEIYKFLDEDTTNLYSIDHPEVDDEVLIDYRNGLKELIEKHKDSHQDKLLVIKEDPDFMIS